MFINCSNATKYGNFSVYVCIDSRTPKNTKVWDAQVLYIKWHVYAQGNGTPLQYSCLENPVDGGAWWAAVQGVAKSRT